MRRISKANTTQNNFTWFVGSYQNAMVNLAGIEMRDFFLNPNACIQAHKKGRQLLTELFGTDITLPPVSTPVIKYGHVNTLGASLNFPIGGEVHHTPLFKDIQEAIEWLKKPVDFSTSGLTPFYLDFRKKLQQAFPDEHVGFGWQWEGPITTAWELNGENFMYDLMDKPTMMKELLYLVTASIVKYCKFFCEVEKTSYLNQWPDYGRICDDIAAMVPAKMWPDFVIEYWDMFFDGHVQARKAHCEDMRPEQLKFLEQMQVVDYDPGISPKLNPKIIKQNISVPFCWRLGGFHYSSMSTQDVTDFVFHAFSDGASCVFSYIEAVMCNNATAEKVSSFIAAAKEAKQMVHNGMSRQQIGEFVSSEYKTKYRNRLRPILQSYAD